MNSFAILKWVLGMAIVLTALLLGDLRTVGMVVTIAAALWYGLILPVEEELRFVTLKSKGRVN